MRQLICDHHQNKSKKSLHLKQKPCCKFVDDLCFQWLTYLIIDVSTMISSRLRKQKLKPGRNREGDYVFVYVPFKKIANLNKMLTMS